MAVGLSHAEVVRRTERSAGFPWRFVLTAFGFTWLICLPGVLAKFGWLTLPFPVLVLVAVSQFGASLAGFVAVYREGGTDGVRRLFKRALDVRIPIRWLIPALILPLVLGGGALLLRRLSGGVLPPLELLAQPVAILPLFVFIFLLQGPVPEEFGWRGYALGRLQERWSALTASLILGMLWALWHLPLFYMEGVAQSLLPFWAFAIQVTAASVLMTWLYNNTDGNLLIALLFHTMINLSIALFPPVDLAQGGDVQTFIYLMALYVLAALLVVLRWGPQTLGRSPGR